MILILLAVFLLLGLVAALVIAILSVWNTPYSDTVLDTTAVRELKHVISGEALELSLAPQAAFPVLLTPDFVERRDRLFLLLVNAFADAGITEWWVTQSTLLGAVRHGSFVPWNDKIKVAVLDTELPKLVSLRSGLDDSLCLVAHKHGYRFAELGLVQVPVVDISIVADNSTEVALCTPLSELGSCTYADTPANRRQVYDSKVVFPLHRKPFRLFNDEGETVDINVPNRAERCLEILYGEQWKTVVEGTHSLPMFCNSYSRALLRSLALVK